MDYGYKEAEVESENVNEEQYEDLDVCSVNKRKGEREYLRELKINMFEGLDMHLYEHCEQGMDMWHRDQIYYSTKKFNADVNLFDVELSEGEAEQYLNK